MSWPMVKLATVASIERSSVQPEAIAGGTRYLGLEHIESGGRIIGGDPVENGDLASSKFAFSNEHVLYGKLRPYLSKIAMPEFDGVCSTDILPIRPSANLDRRYLAYFLRQPDMVAKANSLATGANLPRLSPKALEQIEIPLPPLEEQKRIAGILDQADALRRLRARALEKLNTLGQAVFQEMFGDPQSNPKKWITRPLHEMGNLDRGVSKHRPRNDPALLGGSYPLIQTGDVSKAADYIAVYRSTYSDLGLKQSKLWPKGTVCITIAANIADTAILDFDACFPDSVVGFNSNSPAMNFFIHRWFETIKGHLEAIAPSVAQKNINLSILRDLPVICPSDELVAIFYEREAVMREQKAKLQDALQRSRALFASLQSAAFQGRL